MQSNINVFKDDSLKTQKTYSKQLTRNLCNLCNLWTQPAPNLWNPCNLWTQPVPNLWNLCNLWTRPRFQRGGFRR